jgi:hypothetical protein
MAEYVGHDILRYAPAHGLSRDSLEEAETYLRDSMLVSETSVSEEAEGIVVTIGECGICAKRVDHYRFDGTAGPGAGMLSGDLSAVGRETLVPSMQLVQAETCTMRLSRAKRKVS